MDKASVYVRPSLLFFVCVYLVVCARMNERNTHTCVCYVYWGETYYKEAINVVNETLIHKSTDTINHLSWWEIWSGGFCRQVGSMVHIDSAYVRECAYLFVLRIGMLDCRLQMYRWSATRKMVRVNSAVFRCFFFICVLVVVRRLSSVLTCLHTTQADSWNFGFYFVVKTWKFSHLPYESSIRSLLRWVVSEMSSRQSELICTRTWEKLTRNLHASW